MEVKIGEAAVMIGLMFVPGGQLLSAIGGFALAAEEMNEAMRTQTVADATVRPAGALVDQQEAAEKVASATLGMVLAAVGLATEVRAAATGAKVAGTLAGDAQTLAKLRGIVSDEVELQNLVRLAGGDASRLETFLAASGNNPSRVKNLLTAAGGDAVRLDNLLRTVGNDAGRLEQLLKTAGGDAARLERLLVGARNDPTRLEALLKATGGDPERLEKLLAVSEYNPERLETLLKAVGNDAARLEELADAQLQVAEDAAAIRAHHAAKLAEDPDLAAKLQQVEQKAKDPLKANEASDDLLRLQSQLDQGGSAGAARLDDPAFKINWSSTSKPTFGHTFETHGSGPRNLRGLQGRAAGTGDPQGQWIDDDAAANFLSAERDYIQGPVTVPIPPGLGQVIMPNGTIVPATRAILIPKAIGYRSAYPVL
jgi:hypothetical protein